MIGSLIEIFSFKLFNLFSSLYRNLKIEEDNGTINIQLTWSLTLSTFWLLLNVMLIVPVACSSVTRRHQSIAIAWALSWHWLTSIAWWSAHFTFLRLPRLPWLPLILHCIFVKVNWHFAGRFLLEIDHHISATHHSAIEWLNSRCYEIKLKSQTNINRLKVHQTWAIWSAETWWTSHLTIFRMSHLPVWLWWATIIDVV